MYVHKHLHIYVCDYWLYIQIFFFSFGYIQLETNFLLRARGIKGDVHSRMWVCDFCVLSGTQVLLVHVVKIKEVNLTN